jgi:predicted O-methyltransferase YrrM
MSAEQPPGGGTAEDAAYADRFAVETPEMVEARSRATHLPGSPPVEPAVGAVLAVLAAGVEARSVVSIGSGGGLAGLWLLRGMRADGVLTAWTATRNSCAPPARPSPTPVSCPAAHG